MKTKFGLILMMLVALVTMTSCATINALVSGTELTPAARYYDALKTFNSNVEQYNAIYKLSDAATQAQWKAQIDPLIRSASTALDAWKTALNTPTAASKEEAWKAVKAQLIPLLISSGIVKVE